MAMPDLWGNGEASISDVINMERENARLTKRIQQLEASYQQVSKALCGTENATLEEVLQAVDQVKQNKPGEKLICEITIDGEEILRKAIEEVELDGKTIAEWIELVKGYKQLEAELAAVKRERDAAVDSLRGDCSECKCADVAGNEAPCSSCKMEYRQGVKHVCKSNWQWRGVSPDTEVQDGQSDA